MRKVAGRRSEEAETPLEQLIHDNDNKRQESKLAFGLICNSLLKSWLEIVAVLVVICV